VESAQKSGHLKHPRGSAQKSGLRNV